MGKKKRGLAKTGRSLSRSSKKNKSDFRIWAEKELINARAFQERLWSRNIKLTPEVASEAAELITNYKVALETPIDRYDLDPLRKAFNILTRIMHDRPEIKPRPMPHNQPEDGSGTYATDGNLPSEEDRDPSDPRREELLPDTVSEQTGISSPKDLGDQRQAD